MFKGLFHRLWITGKQRPFRYYRLLAIVIFMNAFLYANAFAQERTITGTVTSATDETPLVGVNVVIKGTTKGTVTDIDGQFEIKAEPDDVLLISYIGHLEEEIPVGDKTEINVSLVEDVAELDEIVVIGYGTQQKKLVTGATAQVKGEDLERRNTLNALQAMQGQSAGINMTSTSGQPGEGMKVVIRGVGTINNEGPLYIVDGVPTGDINHLNSSDIESIDVLKDAASAAIYGSRAANGVILVTTKQGQAGDAQITFDSYYGLQNRPKDLDLLNARQYATIMNEQHLNSGGGVSSLPFNVNDLPAYTEDGSADTDWLDEMFVQNAVTQNYTLGASGGTEQTVYSLSLGYTGQEGIVGGRDVSNYERYNFRLNTENKLYNDRIKIGEHLTYSYVNRNGVSVGNQYDNSLRGAFNVSPLRPVYDDQGNYFNAASDDITDQHGEEYWNSQEGHPYASMKLNNQGITQEQKLLGDIYTEIELFNNFTFRSTFGVDYYSDQGRSYTPIYELSDYSFSNFNSASQDMSKNFVWNWDNVLSYSLQTGVHKIDAMAGTTTRKAYGSWMYTENGDVGFDDLEHAWIDNTTNESDWARISVEGGPNDQDRLQSYFGRLQYNFNETYMFNATFRADGSSKFAEGHRWGYFPSFSAGWVLTNESFMAQIPVVSFLKLRGSWGQNGNQNIESFQYVAPIRFTQATYAFGDEEGLRQPGAYPERLSNEEVKWETSEQLNIGFDSRMLNGKVSLEFDWYQKTTRDWLIPAPILATAGANPPFINGGNVINQGVELMVSWADYEGDFNYKISANGAYNQNEIQEVPTEDGIVHGATNTLYNNSGEFYRAESGYPVGYFWGWETNGIFQNNGEVQAYTNSEGELIQPDAKPGDLRYVDQNDDGSIDNDDKVEVGDPNPDFIFGLSLSFGYKAFDMSVIANGVAGNQIVQSYRSQTDRYANYTTDILDRWRGEGTSNEVPRVTNSNINYRFSDIYVEDGDYLRLSNVSLGVDLAQFMDVKNFSKCRLYAAVENLYTFTGYSGMDPEVGFGFDEGPTDRYSYGVDLGFYPRPRTFLLGLNLNF